MDFTPSLEKVSRAERKLAFAETMLREWTSAGVNFVLRREVHAERAHVIARASSTPPDDVAFEVVEAVGHLRSALDKMIVAVVEANGNGLSGVAFPFGGFDEIFPSPRHERLRKKLTYEQWEILLGLEPYPSGNRLLWAINEIANEDKHRKNLVKVSASASVQKMVVRGGYFVCSGSAPAIEWGGDPDFACPDEQRDTLLASYAFSAGSVHPEVEPAITGRIVFGALPSLAGESVLGTLAAQVSLVRQILRYFS
ncbi:MAG TPA: hypothetical protein VEZ59_05090 [Sphingopyxis sp.]|jgi:hypothetical protein|nr:hypothetical protein [Sphingopyxis sp.]